MITVKKYAFTCLLIIAAFTISAQNLTGTWEGDLGTDQFLQLNILQNGDIICGYTRDHVKGDQQSFCKAYFEGSYSRKERKLTITGRSFIEFTEDHLLMNLELTYKKTGKEEILTNKKPERLEDSSFMSRFRKLMEDPFGQFEILEERQQKEDIVYLRKVSNRPYEIQEEMKDCLELEKAVNDTIAKIEAAKILVDSLESETAAIITLPENDSLAVPKELTKRKNTEQSHIVINVRTINLKVYDNAIMDGDTVSILYNGKVLLSHQLLSEKGIELNIELDGFQTRHEIILFAHNLGSIPPNTALVVITAGEKRYELFASASLQENAVLVFNYRPKE